MHTDPISSRNCTKPTHQFVRNDDDLRDATVEVLLALAHYHYLLFRDAFFVQPLEQLELPVVARGARTDD